MENNKDNNHNDKNKNTKKNYKVLIGTAVIVLAGGTFMWHASQDNAYAITIDSEVVAITKDKETVELAYTNLVEDIKNEVKADIAVNEQLQIKPVRAKEKEILAYDEVAKVISDKISYGIEAYEIIVDGKAHAVIGQANEAEAILAEIANQYLPTEGALTLKVEELGNTKENVETKEDVDSTDSDQEEIKEDESYLDNSDLNNGSDLSLGSELTTEVDKNLDSELDNNIETNIDGQEKESQNESKEVETDGEYIDESLEVIQVQGALPQDEVITQIQVGEIEVEPTIEVAEEENSQEIKRQMNDLRFNENVVVKSVYVPEDQIISVDKAKEVLMQNETVEIEYALQEGDNIWDIAMSHGTTMDKIMELNPQIQDETLMQIGDIIKVEVPKPILSISTVEEAVFKELIPAEIEYVVFSDLYKGETKIYQEGHDGLKELTVEVMKINGEEVARTTTSEQVLKEAKTKVMAYGVKEKPVVTKPENNSQSNSTASSNGSSSNSSSSNSSSSNSSGSSSSSSSGSNSNIGNAKFIHPLKGAGRVSSEYGPRWGTFHHGIDFAAPAGTPIYASAAGKVIYSGYNNGGYGYLVIIDHGNGYQTYYAHNSSLYVSVGNQVSQGQHIAGVGSTGDSTGNHLHFEVRKNGTPINPRNVL